LEYCPGSYRIAAIQQEFGIGIHLPPAAFSIFPQQHTHSARLCVIETFFLAPSGIVGSPVFVVVGGEAFKETFEDFWTHVLGDFISAPSAAPIESNDYILRP